VAIWSPISATAEHLFMLCVQNYKYDGEYNGLTGLFSVIVLNDS